MGEPNIRQLNKIGNLTAQGITETDLATAIKNDRTQLNQINVNAKSYGAKGDGITDDSTALQNALNAAATTGNVLLIPSGNYKYSQTLIKPLNVSITGSSQGNTVLNYTGNSTALNVGNFNNGVDTDFFIRDLTLQGSSNTTCGIYVENVWRSSFINLLIENMTNAVGIHTYGTGNNGVYWNRFESVHLWSTAVGIRFDSDGGNNSSNANQVVNCDVHSCPIGIDILYGDSITIEGTAFELCTNTAIQTNAWGTRIINNRFERNNYDITLNANSWGAWIFGNAIASNNMWIQNNQTRKQNFSLNKYAFSNATTNSPTTNSTSYVLVPEMSVNLDNRFVNSQGDVLVRFSGVIKVSAPGKVWFQIQVNSTQIATGAYPMYIATANQTTPVSFECVVPAGSTAIGTTFPSTYQVLWMVDSGLTATAWSTSRTLTVQALNNSLSI